MGRKTGQQTSTSSNPSELEIRSCQTFVENSTQTLSRYDKSSSGPFPELDVHTHPPHSTEFLNTKSFCDTWNNQLMSDNINVQKQLHCKHRKETKDISEPMPVFKSAPGGLLSTVNPLFDKVTLRSGINVGIAPLVIQPRAMYMQTIYTTPLVFFAYTPVPTLGHVPQNVVLPPSAPAIILKSNTGCPAVEQQPPASNSVTCNNTPHAIRESSIINASDNQSKVSSSSKECALKRKASEGNVRNWKKQCTNNDHVFVVVDSDKSSTDSLVHQDSLSNVSLKAKDSTDAAARKSSIRLNNSVISTSRSCSLFQRSEEPGIQPETSMVSSMRCVSSATNCFRKQTCNYTTKVPSAAITATIQFHSICKNSSNVTARYGVESHHSDGKGNSEMRKLEYFVKHYRKIAPKS